MKRTIQLRKIKDKETKRYLIRYSFYFNNKFQFEQKFDIHDLVLENKWKSITYIESMEICRYLFGKPLHDYALIDKKEFENGIDKIKWSKWKLYGEDGFCMQLAPEDLSIIRDKRIDDILN